MPPRFKRKVHKMRGYRRGFGSKKKHRGGGSQGGHGFAGMHKHKYSLAVSYPKFGRGKKGFHSRKPRERAINIGDLGKLVKEGETSINLTALGYGKLLSRGKAAKLNITVKSCSAKAMQKVEAAGGKVISGS